MAFQSQIMVNTRDIRFKYESLFSGHSEDIFKPFDFLGKILKIPIWVHSMTGGTRLVFRINTNLARAYREFEMGMEPGPAI